MLVIENAHFHEFVIKGNFAKNGLSLERFLKDRSQVMFEEISSGVYITLKDRESYYSKFVNSKTVSWALNDNSRVVIKRLDGKFVTNEDSLEDF